MSRPYSTDLRERVVQAHLAGEPIRSVAARFSVSVSSVPKWVARYRETGSTAPGKIGGHRPWRLEPHRELVHALIGETPHLTIDRLRDRLAAARIAVSRDTIWRFLRREGLSFKKTLFALEQARTAVARKRARWQALKRQLDPDRLVFVDETWIKTNMAPSRGWAKKGKRLNGYAPHGHWRTMTFLAALRSDGLSALRLRRPHQQPLLPGLGRTAARLHPQARRHRHPRQSRQPQGQGGQTGDPGRWRPIVVPAGLFTRPQPDRAGLRQDQALDAERPKTKHRRHMQPSRTPHRHHRAQREPKLHPKRRIWF